jgi:hypothetical protein
VVGRYSVLEGGERILVALTQGEHFAVSDQPAPGQPRLATACSTSFPVAPRVAARTLGVLIADYIADAQRLDAIPMACSSESTYRRPARPGVTREAQAPAPPTAYERAREREQRALAEHALARRVADAERQRSVASRELRRSPPETGIEAIGL